ncbi:MAG: hypothetical protein PWR10_1087 [Halanaerobiales bacterium]|nr:hypothetical protein [Halanaerobiales bacterium]
MGVTIKDIAKRLGVSATAVSKALNDRDDVSNELKVKVRKIAEEMDYSPNSLAKRLVTNKSNTIGVFMFSRQKNSGHDPFGFQFLSGIMEEANRNGYDIVLFSTDSDLLAEKSYIKLCKERKVEGAIFTGLRLDDPHLEEIKESPFPISIIDTEVKGNNVSFISTDNRKGVRLALNYLWKLGHRRIAIINGHKKAMVSHLRYNAYKEFLEEKGQFREELVFTGDFTERSGYLCGGKILELKDRPSAVFVASDLMALGVIKKFKEEGLKLPEEMSIVGFDNIFPGEFNEPALTTIGQNAFEMGVEAVNWVLKRINGEKGNKKILLEPELIIRDSCDTNQFQWLERVTAKS